MAKKEVASFPRDELHVASINHAVQSDETGQMVSVTLCGSATAIAEFVAQHPDDAVELKPQHPWHHPKYAEIAFSR